MRVVKKYLVGLVALILFAGSASAWLVRDALAASGSIYLSPSTSSVQQGSNFTVSLRVNPGGGVNTVDTSVSYDAAKLSVVGVDCSGTSFTPVPSCPTGGNPVAITGVDLAGDVTSDSLVARITFHANAGSGSAAIGLSGNAASSGSPTNPTAAGATVNFTTPAAPPANSGSSGSSATTTSPVKTSTPPKTSTVTGTTPATQPVATSGQASISPVATTVVSSDAHYSDAALTLKSDQPTQVYVSYGTDQQHYTNTPLSELGTNHSITFGSNALVPGETYYYVVVTKDAQGRTTQTAVQTLTTKGMDIKVGIFDKDYKPLRNTTVTLHSKPYTVKTDNFGIATFSNVTPGTHRVIYEKGKKQLTQEISVTNNIQGSGASQTAPLQHMAVVLPISPPASPITTVLPLLLVLLVVGGLYVAYRRGILQLLRDRFALQPQPVDVPQLVTSSSNPATNVATTPGQSTTPVAGITGIPDPAHLAPGTTVAPTNQDQQQ